ncbi:hypothetical protein [Microbispora triticiradicis]|uniref:hypothetical protein n=1 Tax=Microbispora triticiradicis TaxID=2200763 RepID=UPI001AD6C7F0|nr:hypothetical protein [Microbispora triticiradicis]MBO4275661.1 hypothetical protein [Microbispora triticiradicis]
MKKRSMILAGVVITVGLGIGGATAASATSTGAPKPGVACAVTGGPTATGEGRSTVKVDRDGKVFVDGKEAPKSKLRTLCKEPPLPGKGVACIVHVKGDERGEFGPSDEKVYIDGKPAPEGKAHLKCPLPKELGEGADDVHLGDDAPVTVTPN